MLQTVPSCRGRTPKPLLPIGPALNPLSTHPDTQFWPDFLDTFQSYDHAVKRADALRPLVLHTFGGVYLDLDVECFLPMAGMLAGAEVVLQGGTPAEPLTNGVMASAPAAPFWLDVLHQLRARANRTDLDINEQTGVACIWLACLFLAVVGCVWRLRGRRRGGGRGGKGMHVRGLRHGGQSRNRPCAPSPPTLFPFPGPAPFQAP